MRKRGTKTTAIKVDQSIYNQVDSRPYPRINNGEFYDQAASEKLERERKMKQ